MDPAICSDSSSLDFLGDHLLLSEKIKSLPTETLELLRSITSREICKRQQMDPYTKLFLWKSKNKLRKIFVHYSKSATGWLISIQVIDENLKMYLTSHYSDYCKETNPTPKKNSRVLAAAKMIECLNLDQQN
jgi:hypothetical protein